jgi:hypothetical protein
MIIRVSYQEIQQDINSCIELALAKKGVAISPDAKVSVSCNWDDHEGMYFSLDIPAKEEEKSYLPPKGAFDDVYIEGISAMEKSD